MRELQSTTYDSSIHKDENLLYKHKLIPENVLKSNLTYLWGKDDDKFPLQFLTEGQGNIRSIKPKKLNDSQYTWMVLGRMKNTSICAGLVNTSLTKPGLGMQPFDMYFEDNWIHSQYGAVSPDQQYEVRFMNEPQLVAATNKYQVTVVLKTTDPTAYISLDNFIAGKAWAQTAPTVAASKSDGTASNAMVPGEWTNQFNYHRFSLEIAGNIANKVTNIEFDTDSGKSRYWMPFQMKLHNLHIRQMLEEKLWYADYNRNAKGEITLKDMVTGEPIPEGAGVKSILKAVNNYDTYGPVLTKAKLDSTVKAVISEQIGTSVSEIVLYTGKGGAEMFHNAIMTDATSNSYYQALGENVIFSGGEYLSYGKYFRQYKTISGQVITVKPINLFDWGARAEAQKLNGQMYNGYPLESYNLVFLDQSKLEDGERNVTMVCEDGREVLTGIYRGLTNLPGAWGNMPSNGEAMLLSTRKDMAAYEEFRTAGIAITKATTSFWLSLSL